MGHSARRPQTTTFALRPWIFDQESMTFEGCIDLDHAKYVPKSAQP